MQKKMTVWYTLGEAEKATGIQRTRLDHACRANRLPYRRSETGARLLSNDVIERLRKEGLKSFPRPYDPLGIATADDKQSHASPTSGVLQSLRDGIDELNLKGQELRARRDLERLHDEQTDEAERLAEEKRRRKLEQEARREQVRAEHLQQEQLRQEAEAEQRRQGLRHQVQLALHAALPASLPYDQQKMLADQLEAELQRAGVETGDAALPILRSVVS